MLTKSCDESSDESTARVLVIEKCSKLKAFRLYITQSVNYWCMLHPKSNRFAKTVILHIIVYNAARFHTAKTLTIMSELFY